MNHCERCGAPLPKPKAGAVQLRCAACVRAFDYGGDDVSEPVVRSRGAPRLPAACWCEGTTVWVAQHDVLAGRTGSCGAVECAPV